MRDHLPKIFLLLVAGGIALAGAWLYATFVLNSRVAAFQRAMPNMAYARGGGVPDEATALAHARETAKVAEVELSDLAVEMHDERGVANLSTVLAERHIEFPRIHRTLRVYHFTGHVSAHKWLWSLRRDVDVTVSKRTGVHVPVHRRRH